MLTSRDRVEVVDGGTVYDRRGDDRRPMIPSDPGCTRPGGSPLVDMPSPRVITGAGTDVAEGDAAEDSTVNSVPASPTNGSGWSYGNNPVNPPAPLPPVWTGGGHPAMRGGK